DKREPAAGASRRRRSAELAREPRVRTARRLALAGVTPVISVLERRASGLWRSGSASHWQCGGRGFESRQLHRGKGPALNRGGTAEGSPFRPLCTRVGREGVFVPGGNRRTKEVEVTSEVKPKIDRYVPAAIEAK